MLTIPNLDKAPVRLLSFWQQNLLPAPLYKKLETNTINAIAEASAGLAADYDTRLLLEQHHHQLNDLLHAMGQKNQSYAPDEEANTALMEFLANWQAGQSKTIGYLLIDSHIHLAISFEKPKEHSALLLEQLQAKAESMGWPRLSDEYYSLPLADRSELGKQLRQLQQEAVERGYAQHVLDWPWFEIATKYRQLLEHR